jgi:hypothetical protein
MSKQHTNAEPCELVREIEAAAREVRRKAADDWSSPVSTAYYQCSLELKRIVSRHRARRLCVLCREEEAQLDCASDVLSQGAA